MRLALRHTLNFLAILIHLMWISLVWWHRPWLVIETDEHSIVRIIGRHHEAFKALHEADRLTAHAWNDWVNTQGRTPLRAYFVSGPTGPIPTHPPETTC